MHPLQNGSQVTERPANKPVSGLPGYFTESGENNVPSYPGADWFNNVIDEFLNALSSQSVAFDPSKTDNLANAFQGISEVVDKIKPLANDYTVNIRDFDSLKSAIDALPSNGGVVLIPEGRWWSGDYDYNNNYMAKPGVRLVGEKLPSVSANADRLIDGSIIYGRFNCYADYLSVEEVGFDMGKYTIDTHFGGADTLSPDYPYNGGTWDAFAFAQPNIASPLRARIGCDFKSIIGLQSRPDSLGHSVLIENASLSRSGHLIGVYGRHGVVVKCQDFLFEHLEGYMCTTNNVIFKSNSFALCGRVFGDHVKTGTTYPNTNPHIAPLDASYGFLINPESANFSGPVTVNHFHDEGSSSQLHAQGTSSYQLGELHIGSITSEGFSSKLGVNSVVDNQDDRIRKVSIGSVVTNNVNNVLASNSNGNTATPSVTIGALVATNVDKLLKSDGPARISIGSLNADNVDTLYDISDSTILKVGSEILTNVSNVFSNPATLTPDWENYGFGNSSFGAVLSGGKVCLSGLVKSLSDNTTIATLPPFLRPQENLRFSVYFNDGSVHSTALLTVDSPTGAIEVGSPSPSPNDYISLDGVSWVI
ncbi:hypothetical protein P3596_02150 [Vibrio parahaemolyticus]|nr:hypothetical protein [Vibrio parahaemolyticus]